MTKLLSNHIFEKTNIIYYFLLFSAILLLFGNSSCKNHSGRLNQELNIFNSDSTRADSLYRFGKAYSRDSLNQEVALPAFEEALKIYQKLNEKDNIAKLYKNIGYVYDYLEDFPTEIAYLKKSYKLSLEAGNMLRAGRVLDDIGICYTILGKLDSAIANYEKGLEISIAENDSIEVIEFYQNMGIAYAYRSDYEKAIECHLQTLELSEKYGYTLGVFNAYLNLSEDYNDNEQYEIAFSYLDKANQIVDQITDKFTQAGFYDTYAAYYNEQKDYKTAAIYYNKCLEVSKSVNYKRGMACSYSNLSSIALYDKNYEKALDYAELSLQLEKKINNISGIILSHCEIAECHYEQYHFNKAILHLSEAEKLSIKADMYDNLSEVLYHFYKVYQKSGNPEKALQYYEDYYQIKDSLDNVEVKERIAALEIKYQTEKKQQEIELLNKDNETKKQKIKASNRLILLLVLLLVLILGIAYFFRQHNLKKLYRIESELQKYILRLKDIETKEQEINHDFTSRAFSQKYDLTEREIEVLILISEGLSNVQIAEKIFVSTNTIKFHIKNIYIKLDVKNRVEALNKLQKSA